MLSLRGYIGKQIVSYLRQGDFAHPGEEEAIDLVMNRFSKDRRRQILDAGCGLGGTAHYLQQQDWGKVTGLDIESKSIEYARTHYPDVTFYIDDVCHVNQLFRNKTFDLICLFNSYYAFNNQSGALLALNKIAKTSSELVLFDYSIASSNANKRFYREGYGNQLPFKPIIIETLNDFLQSTKWQLNELINISDKYILWYEELLQKLKKNENYITDQFGKDAYHKAHVTYSDIYNGLIKEALGGVIVYAKKLSE